MAYGKHTFVNPIPDDPAFPGTKPSDWNADIPVILGADENFVTNTQLTGVLSLLNLINTMPTDGNYLIKVTGGILTWEKYTQI